MLQLTVHQGIAELLSRIFFYRSKGRRVAEEILPGRRPGGNFLAGRKSGVFFAPKARIFFEGPEEISLVAWRKFSLPARRIFYAEIKKNYAEHL